MRRVLRTLRVWFDSWAVEVDLDDPDAYRVDWLRVLPFVAVHLACLGPIWVGWSPIAVGVAVALYWLGLIWKLAPVPEKARRSGLVADGAGR